MEHPIINYYFSDKNSSRAAHKNQDDAAGVLLDRSERMDSEKKALLKMILDQGGTFE